MQKTKNIVVAPLNWGLGHATRCIPVIRELIACGFTPILASDGAALLLLQKEFPNLESIILPSYGITYPKNGKYFTIKLLLSLPKLLLAIQKERKIIADLVANRSVKGIISDNRFGVRNTKVPSVYMTHQLKVLSGVFTFWSTTIHEYVIKKFDECWVPDVAESSNFSGVLGHFKRSRFGVEYMGILSRFQYQKTEINIDYLVLLSGPEPQRGMLEQKLFSEFKNTDKKVVFVLGKVKGMQTCIQEGNITIYNYMLSKELSATILQSEVVIARSGYTTIMDLAILQKKAFFIPTPGQFEQLYLAKRLNKLKLAPFAFQEDFNLKQLEKIASYKGLSFKETGGLKALFALFK